MFCEVTASWIADKIRDGRCEVTGLPFSLDRLPHFRVNPLAPSLDQVRAGSGYTFHNTRLVCAGVNTGMGPYGEAIWGMFARAWVRRNGME